MKLSDITWEANIEKKLKDWALENSSVCTMMSAGRQLEAALGRGRGLGILQQRLLLEFAIRVLLPAAAPGSAPEGALCWVRQRLLCHLSLLFLIPHIQSKLRSFLPSKSTPNVTALASSSSTSLVQTTPVSRLDDCCVLFLASCLHSVPVSTQQSNPLVHFTYGCIFGCAGASLLHGLFYRCSRRGLLSLLCVGFSPGRLLLWGGHGLWCAQASPVVARTLSSFGSRALEHRLSSVACGTFPDQRSNPGLLHWQADSYSLSYQGSPRVIQVTSVYPVLWPSYHWEWDPVRSVAPRALPAWPPSLPCHSSPPRSDLSSHADPWIQSSGPSWPSRLLSWWPPCLVSFSSPFQSAGLVG